MVDRTVDMKLHGHQFSMVLRASSYRRDGEGEMGEDDISGLRSLDVVFGKLAGPILGVSRPS
jgi:hypothetical protein